MTPRRAIAALRPAPVRVGNLELPSLTPRGWLALEASGHPLVTGGALTALEVWRAAALLLSPRPVGEGPGEGAALDTAALRLADATDCRTDEVLAGLHRLVDDAFATAGELTPPAAYAPANTRRLDIGAPPPTNGIGWLLTLVEATGAEYGWPLATVLDLPLATLCGLRTAAKLREGFEWAGPNWEDLDRLAAREAGSGKTEDRSQEAGGAENPMGAFAETPGGNG